MTLRFTKQGAMSSEFERRADGAISKKMDIVERVLEEEGLRGGLAMEHIVRTEGVRNHIPNGEGRVQSGDMANAVDFDVKRTARHTVRLRVGWLPGNRKKYFGFQNDGTYDKGRPKGILPLLAAQRTHDETRDRIQTRLRRK